MNAMAALEASLSILSSYSSSSSFKPSSSPKQLPSTKLHAFNSTSPHSLNSFFRPLRLVLNSPRRNISFELGSAVQEIAVEEKADENEEINLKKKLFIYNLPWSLTVVDIKDLFGQCGTIADVEIIKQKNGKSRGFAFVTMASAEEAQAVIDKFDSTEISGRVIKVEFAKRFKRPPPPPPSGPPPGETRHKLYVSNLAWKVRSNNLREFFSENFNPVSARVVFDSPSGRSAGYGFVSFATHEEAEAAISSLDGKELMGRPLRLKFSETNIDESESATAKEEEEESASVQQEES